ncbi:MAG: peptidoglycan DD-metalloendopeptidase family protein [Sphingomonadales bacterium]|nr:peptidoglycan DD-metalloendopeptidase family protein [Sphingomonadales bacterium]
MKAGLAALALALLAAPPGPAGAREKPAAAKPAASAKKLSRTAPKPAPTVDDDVPAPDAETIHIVKPGETLGGIAQRAKVPRVLIAEANHLAKPWKVHAGQKLRLPRTRHHIVKAGETGFDIAYRYGVPFNAIAVANGLAPRAVLKPGQDLLIPTILAPATPAPAAASAATATIDAADEAPAAKPAARAGFVWPLDGKVRRGFTPRTSAGYHDGIDIVADPGSPVRAAAAGTVIFAGREPKSFGNLVVIQHDNGWQSAYGFLGRITVAKGDAIRKRERLGLVGRTGKATRDELHFELRKANQPLDPLAQLPSR